MNWLTRRRFLAVSACAALGASARSQDAPQRVTWQGVAFGADIRITLDGPEQITRPALARARLEIEAYEARFSLFRADSQLVQLNAQGGLPDLDRRWHDIVQVSDRLHEATEGLFDPTIQSLWLAHAYGLDLQAARSATGWQNVQLPGPGRRGLRLASGQALTFNGIAQGAATDAVRQVLRKAGLTHVLVDIGETATIGGPWHLGFSDPLAGLRASVRLTDAAFAVSSPGALQISASASHILDPSEQRLPKWASVGVVATDAALADGFSTAACLMTEAALRSAARRLDGVTRLLLADAQGRLTDITL